MPDYLTNSYLSSQLASNGDVIYTARAQYIGGGGSDVGLWRTRGGLSTLLLKYLDPTPDLPAGTVIGNPSQGPSVGQISGVNTAGQFLMSSVLSGPTVTASNNEALYWFSGTSFRLAVREGDFLPGLANPVSLARAETPANANFGYLRITTSSAGGSVHHIYSYDGTSISPVVNDAAVAPGIPGVLIRNPQLVTTSDDGAIMFYSDLSLPVGQRESLWRHVGGVTSLIAKPGLPISSPAGWFVRGTNSIGQSNWNGLSMNDAGDALIFAAAGPTTSDQRESLCLSVGSSLSVIARDLQTIPGGGATFKFLNATPRGQLSNSGMIAFETELNGLPDRGVFAYTLDDGLIRIAVPGDVLQVGPGDFRTVLTASLGFPVGDNGLSRTTGLLDNGDLYFLVVFTDQTSAVLRTSLVPAPGGLVVLTCAFGFLNRRRAHSWQRRSLPLGLILKRFQIGLLALIVFARKE